MNFIIQARGDSILNLDNRRKEDLGNVRTDIFFGVRFVTCWMGLGAVLSSSPAKMGPMLVSADVARMIGLPDGEGQSVRLLERPLSADGLVDLTGLKGAVSASQLGRASQAIVAESEHRAARDAPVSLCFDTFQPTGPQEFVHRCRRDPQIFGGLLGGYVIAE